MTREDAIDVITRHYPPSNYTELCEAIELAITELSKKSEPLTDREKKDIPYSYEQRRKVL